MKDETRRYGDWRIGPTLLVHRTMSNPIQGNLLNRHSHKYSGLANSKVLNIYATADGQIAITKVKADAKPNQASITVGPCYWIG